MTFEEKFKGIELKSLNISQDQVQLTQQVYTDLVLMKKWKHVEYKAVPEINKCILIGCEPGTQEELIIIPVLQQDKFTLNRLSDLFNALKVDIKSKCTMAIYCPDSTIVYYHISKGLCKPTERN